MDHARADYKCVERHTAYGTAPHSEEEHGRPAAQAASQISLVTICQPEELSPSVASPPLSHPSPPPSD